MELIKEEWFAKGCQFTSYRARVEAYLLSPLLVLPVPTPQKSSWLHQNSALVKLYKAHFFL